MTAGPAPAPALRLVVLGGGFAGAALAAHLLRLTRRPVEIAVVEPRPRLGAGLAYGGEDPAHRINVPSDKMTVFADDPAHLTRWLEATGRRAADPEGESGEGWHYCRRADFGAYMGHVLAEALAAAPRRSALRHLRAAALSATPAAGGVAVRLDDGTTVAADEAVVAVSHERPAMPCPVAPEAAAHPGLIPDPWDAARLAAIPPGARVAILGTGLTMVDVACGLLARGSAGPILAVSRRAQLPLGHGRFDAVEDPLDGAPPPRTALALLRLARALVAARDPDDWHPAIDGLRRQAEALWRALPAAEQARALRLRPFWDVRRYRIAPQLGAAIARARSDGRLRVRAAAALGVGPGAAGSLAVTLRAPRGGGPERIEADAVVNCTGPSQDIARTANPLVRDLLARGLARPDPHRLGLDVDPAFRLLGADGHRQQRLRAVGPVTRGVFWEVVGVPELSAHCLRLAEALCDAHGLRATATATAADPATVCA